LRKKIRRVGHSCLTGKNPAGRTFLSDREKNPAGRTFLSDPPTFELRIYELRSRMIFNRQWTLINANESEK